MGARHHPKNVTYFILTHSILIATVWGQVLLLPSFPRCGHGSIGNGGLAQDHEVGGGARTETHMGRPQSLCS